MDPWTVQVIRPISVWDLYAGNGKIRRKSGKYISWRRECGAELVRQGPRPQFTGPVHVRLQLGEGAVSSAFDADNAWKAYLDLIVEMGVIPDDNRKIVRKLVLEWVAGDASFLTVEEA